MPKKKIDPETSIENEIPSPEIPDVPTADEVTTDIAPAPVILPEEELADTPPDIESTEEMPHMAEAASDELMAPVEPEQAVAEEKPKRRATRRSAKKAEEAVPAAEDQANAPDAPEETPENEEPRSFFDLDFNALDRDLSPEQRQEWNSIYASYRGRSVLTGNVIGIDRHSIRVRDRQTGEMVRKEMYCAIVMPFRVRILIPESEMWTNGEDRPGFVMRNLTGAVIDFVIVHVDREAGFAIGSRRMALSSRRYYFSTQPTMNSVGSRVKCRMLAVGPRRCLVECHGHDIDLTQRDLRYTAIPDLRDEYHPGQELDCIVKAYDRGKNSLSISVKETNPNPFDEAVLRHPEGCRRQAVIAGKYAGGVFCNLQDGVVIMCSYSFHYDDAAFAIGDRVILLVQRYDFSKKQIYGKIVAKW